MTLHIWHSVKSMLSCFVNKQKRPFLTFRIFKKTGKPIWMKMMFFLLNLMHLHKAVSAIQSLIIIVCTTFLLFSQAKLTEIFYPLEYWNQIGTLQSLSMYKKRRLFFLRSIAHFFYTNLHELFCPFISWTNWVNSGKFMDNC